MAFSDRTNVEHTGKVIKCVRLYDVLWFACFVKGRERQAMTIKPMLEAPSCEEAPHGSEEGIKGGRRAGAGGKHQAGSSHTIGNKRKNQHRQYY